MKKVLFLALGALLATSMSARDVRKGQKEVCQFKGGDKVLVIKELPKGQQIAFRGDRRQADFRKEQFRKKDFRRGPKHDCPKCRKFHKRPMRR